MKPPLEYQESILFPWDLEKAQWAVITWNQMVDDELHPADQPMERNTKPSFWKYFVVEVIREEFSINPEGGFYFDYDEVTFQHLQYMVEIATLNRQDRRIFHEMAQWVIWLQQIRYNCPNGFTVILNNGSEVAKFSFTEDTKVTLTMVPTSDWMRGKGFGTDANLAPQWETGLVRPASVESEALNTDKLNAMMALPIARLRELLRIRGFKPSVRFSKTKLANWYLTGQKPE